MNFWIAQQQARRKTTFMIGAFVVLTLGVAYIADSVLSSVWFEYSRTSFPWVGFGFIVLTFAVALINYSQYKSQGGAFVASSLGAHAVNLQTPDPKQRQLLNQVEEIALASGMPMPQVFILDNPQINAFAAGTKPENACVCVTTGALKQLSRDELQGVIAHEFGHIYNRDVKLSMQISAMLMGFFIIFYMAIRTLQFAPMRRSDNNKGNAPTLVIAMVFLAAGALSYFAGKVLSALISQQREYLADASSVQFTRNPEGLIGALKKIEKESKFHEMPKEGMAFSHLYFDNRGYFGRLFATHPPIEDRIKALVGLKYLPEENEVN
ncbi:MAG: M48 family metallopeptidase [Chlamydiia bacterium]|nr:M48 family metallopeptidase [Chlamydiia bacterium]